MKKRQEPPRLINDKEFTNALNLVSDNFPEERMENSKKIILQKSATVEIPFSLKEFTFSAFNSVKIGVLAKILLITITVTVVSTIFILKQNEPELNLNNIKSDLKDINSKLNLNKKENNIFKKKNDLFNSEISDKEINIDNNDLKQESIKTKKAVMVKPSSKKVDNSKNDNLKKKNNNKRTISKKYHTSSLQEELKLFNLASHYSEKGNHNEALKYLDKLEQHYPKTILKPEIEINRVNYLIKAGKVKQAVNAIEKILLDKSDDERKPELNCLLGDLWLKLDDCKKAVNFFKKALMLNINGEERDIAMQGIKKCKK